MTETTTLQERYADVCRRVGDAARRSGRSPGDVIVVGVTKFAELDQIRALAQMGHRDFGENRVQQLVQRAAVLGEFLTRLHARPGRGDALDPTAPGGARAPDSVRWHMIGRLQRNKARKVIELTRLIHSVDSLRLAEELQQAAARHDRAVEVLVQVNVSGEESKQGCPAPAALHLCEQIDTMAQLRCRGLMTMAPLSPNPEDARPVFARCRDLFEEIRDAGIGAGRFNILSMGMSGDYEVAIEEGSNLVRVGSALFGEPRNPVDEPGDED